MAFYRKMSPLCLYHERLRLFPTPVDISRLGFIDRPIETL